MRMQLLVCSAEMIVSEWRSEPDSSSSAYDLITRDVLISRLLNLIESFLFYSLYHML